MLVRTIGLFMAFFWLAAEIAAQSGTSGGGFVNRRPTPGLGEPNRVIPGERPLLAMGGFDPISVRNGKPALGQASLVSTFDSQQYQFADPANKQSFDADPKKYAPALSGWSIYSWTTNRILEPGRANHAVVHKDRLYLFATAMQVSSFESNPSAYVDADLLLDGLSPVSLVDAQSVAKGDPKYEAIFEGWRVRFVSEAEKKSFLENVGKYYPTFAGADPIALFNGEVKMGDPKRAFHYKNRLYLFATGENADKFTVEYKTYSDLDVAQAGCCLVTLSERGIRQLGRYGVTTVYLGRRFLFANDENRKKFESNPTAYYPPKMPAPSH